MKGVTSQRPPSGILHKDERCAPMGEKRHARVQVHVTATVHATLSSLSEDDVDDSQVVGRT